MGISSSSLLDESKSNFIRGRADAVLKDFSAYYKRQYLVAFFSKVQDEVEQKKMGQTQLLKQREPPKPAEVLYEENVLFFDDTRKWKERVVVVRANYSLECHDSYETFVKGIQSRHKLLPTGGTALTSEEQYMVLVDKLCPDLNNAKEEFAPPMATMPGQFPVYLRLPYRRDSYFCFRQEARRTQFLSVLTDCIRHQNQDFLRKSACEVEAFRKALRFYRQEKGLYDSWDMLIGSDVRVLANMVMEELLPTLQTELLPRLKGKKTDRKKAWFATVEAAYILVQEQLLKGLSGLKQECRVTAKQQEARIRSDMDQIITSRDFLAGKLRAMVTEPAAKFCSEKVQPHLAPVLEELMGPVSMGFQETRTLCERQMSQLCQDFQESSSAEELKLALEQLRKTNLQGCYAHVDVLQDQLRELQSHYNFSNCTGLVHSTQIDMQQLMGNAAYTFEQLLHTALKDSPAKPGSVMEKAKHRVLKQYDYDSSTMRKRIFQEALLDITLPAMKKNLAPTCKPELQAFDQYIFADYSNFIQVENVYEDILLQTLESEVSKVVNEAASLKRHNLFLDGTDMRLASQSSLSEGLTPPGSTPSSPSKTPQSQNADSPLLRNGQLVNPEPRDTSSVTERELVENAEKHVTTETVNGDARSSPEAEEITSSTPEADKQVTSSTPEADKQVTPSTPEADKQLTSSTPEADKQLTSSTPEADKQLTSSTAEADKQVTSSTPEAETVILLNPPESTMASTPSVPETEQELTPSTAETEHELTPSTAETEHELTPSTAKTEQELTPSTAETEHELTPSTAETEQELTPSTAETEQELTPSTAKTEHELTPSTAETEQELTPSTAETQQELTPSTAETQQENKPNTAEAEKELTPSTAETEQELTPSTAETQQELTPSTADTEQELTPSTAETQQELTPSTADTEQELTPSTAETQQELTPSTADTEQELTPSTAETEQELTPSTVETEQENKPNTAEAEKELTSSTAETQQENKPNTAEVEKESTASTDEGVHSVAEVEKEVTPSESQTEDLPGATEAEEDTPFAAELTDEDTIRTGEAEQEDVPSASEIPAETIAPAASLQTVEPLLSPSPDSAGEEHPDVDGMVDTSSNPPLAEAGTESPSMLVIEQAEENDGSDAETAPTHPCSDAITDTGAPSTGCSKISVDSPEVDGDIGVMSAEDSEDGGTAGSSSEPTEEVTESDVSLTSDLTAEGTEGNPETLNVDHVSEATETEVCADATPTAELAEEGVVTLDVSLTSSPTSEVTESDPETISVDPVSEATEIQECVDAVPNAEEAEEGVVTLGDEPVSEPTENSLPTAAVSPRVSSPAEAKPAEEPGQVKAQAPDCIKEIRSLVVEVIEVEEMVQHYPGGSSS